MNKNGKLWSNHIFYVFTVCILVFITIPCGIQAQDGAREVQLLWEEGPPNAKGNSDLDKPSLTIFLPDRDKATNTGVIICPGGGYSHLAMEKEGYKVARWFNSMGIAAFVVKYRLGVRYHHPAQLMDGKRAMQIVRKNAQDWGVNPNHIGIMGFSAGGHLASTVGTHFDAGKPDAGDPYQKYSSRPDFMILLYPVITMQNNFTHRGSQRNLLGEHPDSSLIHNLSNEMQVTPQTPPTFLVHTSNDSTVPVMNSVQFYMALRKAGVPAELHIYEDGPHGFGLAQQYSQLSSWTYLCKKWMKHRNLLGGHQTKN